ncbi:MAG: phage major capsid protein [Candidatus Dormibacteria bacterium]
MPGSLVPQTSGFGYQLTAEEWDAIIYSPLVGDSAVLSLESIHSHSISGPLHLPTLDVPVNPTTAFHAAGDEIIPVAATTNEVVLFPRGLKGLKIIVLISNETIRSAAADPLSAATEIITKRLTKVVDTALLAGNSGAGITGLLPLAGTTIDASNTTVYPSGSGLNVFTDALTTSLDAAADPDVWLVNTRTLGVLMKQKDSLGRSLLVPNPSQQSTDMLLSRPVVPTPNMPLGTAALIDSSQVHLGVDLEGQALVLAERYAEFDAIGLRVVSRFDVQVINSPGVVVITGLGPAA